MKFDAPFAASSVGSFPHQDPSAACELILDSFPEVPVWPQLPATNLHEQMEIQYSEGLPSVVIDESRQRMYIETGGDTTAALERFYENYLADNLDYFAITEDFARGIPGMERLMAQSEPSSMKYFKMQVTGPVTFALTIVNENKRAIYYDDMFRDVVVKGMAMKARWQLRRFRQICDKRICVIDEPILSAFGSSTYVSVKRDDVVAYINEVVEAIHAEGGIAGIHCCGNTEWTIPMDAGVDIISFDAYEYGESMTLYPEDLKSFMQKGGILSWGLVPTSERIEQETTESLLDKLESLLAVLADKGIDRELLLQNSLVTGSCGTGTVTVERAKRVAEQTNQVSEGLRKRYPHLTRN
jgi:hypothetical protein